MCVCTFPWRKHFPLLKCFNMVNTNVVLINTRTSLKQAFSLSLQSSVSLNGNIGGFCHKFQSHTTHNFLSQVIINFNTFFLKASHNSAITLYPGRNDCLDFLPQLLKTFDSQRIKVIQEWITHPPRDWGIFPWITVSEQLRENYYLPAFVTPFLLGRFRNVSAIISKFCISLTFCQCEIVFITINCTS